MSAVSMTAYSSAAVIFTENMGTPSGTTPIASNEFENEGVLSYSGTADVRTSLASTGYTGASGGGNVFFTSNGSASFIISNIDTTGFEPGKFTLSFGAYKSTTSSNMTDYFSLSYSTNGIDWTNIAYPDQATGSGTANWRLITLENLALPITENLSLRWLSTAPGGSGVDATQFRLDDVTLSGVVAPEPGTYAMLLLGGGLTFLMLRRRR